ncbi:hypothetical protein MVEN_00370700 [Mycena venus]|uniref:Mid2 domain-containing protein n=1 Tax=Mycena venus TaxID=2733690 RepID=A0A8H6YTP0_9AGAR|nr:hypothetical protein MVEN_00370700 [Mycena venus]
MFLLAYLSVLGVVALGPQVVLGSFKFSLSPVVQCQPVDITFSGSDANNHSVPTTLTILPLLDNIKPIQIPIPNGASNSTGIQLTFIPLPAGTRFVASLDDVEGPTAKVSDVTRVLNSTTGPDVEGCFGSSIQQVNFYEFDDNLAQCEDFTVTYNTPVTVAPTIRAFFPNSGSLLVPQSNASTAPNTASYTMTGLRSTEVVLLFDDTQGHLQTTKLITIDGDSSSSKSCFKSSSKDSDGNNKAGTISSTTLPRSAIIGIAVGAAVVGLFAILLLIYIVRTRRRNRRVSHMNFDPSLLNQKWPPDLEERKVELYQSPALTAPSAPTPSFSAQGFVRDPIYTNEKYASSIISDDARTSIASWNQFIPEDQRNRSGTRARGQSVSSSRLSMGTVEAQDILQMATVHRTHYSGSAATVQGRPTPQPSTAGTTMTTFDVAKPAIARLVSTRRSGRSSDPPDMPIMPVTVSRNNSTEAAIAGVPAGYRSSYMSYGDGDEDDTHTARQSDGIGGYPIPSFKTSNLRPRDTGESWGNVVVQ